MPMIREGGDAFCTMTSRDPIDTIQVSPLAS
jgi:hypothetical protein